YRCFDRLLLNGLIQPFQQPERVLGFFNTYRDGKRVTRRTLTEIADQFQYWLKNRSEKWDAPILEPPDGTGDDSRRDKFMDPYFPFSARVCLNQHHWLAARMREEGIDFQQSTNAFLECGNPARLQEMADSLTTRDLLSCGQKWLAAFTPFITDKERRQAGCQH